VLFVADRDVRIVSEDEELPSMWWLCPRVGEWLQML